MASLQGPKGGPGPEEQKDETRLQGPKGGPGPQDQKDEKRLQGPTGGPGPQDQKEVTGLQGPKDELRLQGPKGEPRALGSTLHILRGQPSNSFHWPRRTAPGHVYVPDAKIITID